MKKIKVVHITYSLDIGGAEVVILDLMRGINRDVFELTVCSLSKDMELAPEFKKAGIPTRVVEKSEGKDWKLFFRLFSFFRKGRFDIVHCHNMYMLLYCALPAKLAGVKSLILTEHANKRNPSRLYCLGARVVQKITDLITVNSLQVINALVQEYGLSRENIVTIPNGIDCKCYENNKDTSSLRREFSIQPDDVIVGIVGRLVPVKDHMTLLKAFKLLLEKAEGRSVKLLIVGAGSELDRLRKYSHENKIDGNIIFAGYRRDILSLLSMIDIFVLSSLKEGQSISILEAMATGLPVVATAVGGTPELVVDQKTGILIPAEDPRALAEALYTLISKPDFATNLGDEGKKRIHECYNLKKIVQQYEDYYHRSLASPSIGGRSK